MPKVLKEGQAPAQSVSVRDGKRISEIAADMAYILRQERGEPVEIADVMAEAFEMYRVFFCTQRASRTTTFQSRMSNVCGGGQP
jgi:hypothetical protein